MTNSYQEYRLTHWEEPDIFQRIIATEGVVSVTPEMLNRLLQSYHPVAYREGQITVDVDVRAFEAFWKSLGGKMER